MDDYNEVIDGELFKFEKEGDSVEGVLKAYTLKPNTGKGEGHVYEVRTINGVAAFFAPTLLQKKLSGIPLGSVLKITFKRTDKTAIGNPLKIFEVGVIDVVKDPVKCASKIQSLGLADEYSVIADTPEEAAAVVPQGMKPEDVPFP